MPAGRPTKYHEGMAEEVSNMGHEGESLCEMAQALGIHWDTFCQWRKEKPAFSDAVKQARRNSQVWWERQGRLATFGGTEGFNATSYIFNMKNRFPDEWRDKHEVEHAGGLTVNVIDSYGSNPE
jgi:hypothetical protein